MQTETGFNQVLKAIAPLADNGFTKQERARAWGWFNKRSSSMSEHTRSLTKSVLHSRNPQQAITNNFRGRSLPSHYSDPYQNANATLTPTPVTAPIDGRLDMGAIKQGQIGSCVILSAAPGNVRLWVNNNGTSTYRFKGTFDWNYVTVDHQVATIDGSNLFATGDGDAALLEKAFAIHLSTTEGLGVIRRTAHLHIVLDKLGLATGSGFKADAVVNLFVAHTGGLGLSTHHSYRVLTRDAQTTTMWNPWGQIETVSSSELDQIGDITNGQRT